MMIRFTCLLFAVFVLYSCTQDNPILNPQNGHRSLSSFTVTVVDRASNTAIITWTEATNIYNADTVKYKIVLNGLQVDSNRIPLIDTLYNLRADSVYNGRVFASTQSGDTASAPFLLEKISGYIVFGDNDGTLNCYNIYSGNRIWQTPVTYSSYRFPTIPTIFNDVVYANSTGQGIFAFNAKTGIKIWSNDFGHPNTASSLCNPIYLNQKIYTTYANGVYALNSANGQIEWTYTGGVNDFYDTNPTIGGNLLFVGVNGAQRKIIAINIATGTKSWEYILSSFISDSPVLYNNSFIIFGGSDGKIYAVNQSTGTLAWSRNFGVTVDNFGSDFVSPVIYNNLVIFHNGNSGYYGLNAVTGATVWNYPAAATPHISSPAVGNGLVYFVMANSPNSKAIALNASTGSPVWEHTFGRPVDSPTPIFAKNRLYFGGNTSYGSTTQVLNAATGNFITGFAYNVSQIGPPTIVANDSTFYVSQSGMVQ